MTDGRSNQPTPAGCLRSGKAAFIIISALGVAIVGLFALNVLSSNLQKSQELAEQMPALAIACIRHRYWLVLASLPPVVLAALMLRAKSSAQTRWILFALAQAWLLIIFGLILHTFVASLVPLYQYQPL